MKLNEAKKILNDNGYELLDEGKLGRALGIGALALGSLFAKDNTQPVNCEEIYLSPIASKIIYNEDYNFNEDDYKCFKTDEGYVFELNKNGLEKYNKENYDNLTKVNIFVNTNGYLVAKGFKDNISSTIHYYNSDEEIEGTSNTDEKGMTHKEMVYGDNDEFTSIIDVNKSGKGIEKLYYGNIYKDNRDSLKLKAEIPIKNNKRNGLGFYYFDSGELEIEVPYKNGLENGIVKQYFKSGNLALTYKMVNDEQVGFVYCADGRKGNANITCYDE